MSYISKSISILLLSMIFVSCSNILEKRVIKQPLTEEDIKIILENGNYEFLDFYKSKREVLELFFQDKINAAKYGDITYNRLYKYWMIDKDTFFINEIKRNSGNEWSNRYGETKRQIDSIMLFWDNYNKKESLNKFLNIELKDIKYKYDMNSMRRNIYEVPEMYFVFKINPLLGNVDGFFFHVSFIPSVKFNKKDVYHNGIMYTTGYDVGVFETDYPTKNESEITIDVNQYKFDNILLNENGYGISIDAVKALYHVNIWIERIKMDGIWHNFGDYMQEPGIVSLYRMESSYADSLSRELLHKKYVSKQTYQYEYYKEKYKAKDPLCYELINELIQY